LNLALIKKREGKEVKEVPLRARHFKEDTTLEDVEEMANKIQHWRKQYV
jgi:hypothetical protein